MQQTVILVSAITLNPSTQDLIPGMGSQELHSVSLQQQLHHISKKIIKHRIQIINLSHTRKKS
jgi:hypothetical protein